MPLVEVPFNYKVSGAPKGKRKLEDYSFAGRMAVQIDGPTDAEAPVVLRRHRGVPGASASPPARDYRYYDGRLFSGYLVARDEAFGLPMTVDELLEVIRAGTGCGRNPLYDGVDNLFRRPLREDEEIRRTMKIDRSWEDEVASEIARRARDLILVDGIVYRHFPGIEPIYEIVPEAALDRDEGVILAGTVHTVPVGQYADDPAEIDVRRHFRVDQLAETLVACSAANDRFKDWDSDDPTTFVHVVGEYVEVLDPSALAFRPSQGPKLLKFARSLVTDHAAGLAGKPVGFMVAYAGIRDALSRKAGAAEVAPLVRAFAEEMDRTPGRSPGLVSHVVGEVDAFELSPEDEPAAAPVARAA